MLLVCSGLWGPVFFGLALPGGSYFSPEALSAPNELRASQPQPPDKTRLR